ncbi:hypothetical protein [uncultured Aquimarina sp.]|uniref:hypothetical protein n=1 Tax=uncultured Aquimarina sp. TaxID=575652 RepID=UPI002607BA43|nr:hypothetical protein [uncultured Aquimarina sp.]
MKSCITYLLIVFFIISCNNEKEKNKDGAITSSSDKKITEDAVKLSKDSIVNYITDQDINYKPKTVDGHTWIPVQFLKSIYEKGVNNINRNQTNYPFESVFIEDWNDKKIYTESAGLDYRKIRVKVINDSTYYLTDWNKHHYKKNDSIFIVKRNNEIGFVAQNDSIPYTSGIGIFPFKNSSLIENIHRISLYNKTFSLLNNDQLILDGKISFDLSTNTINNSIKFKQYSLTSYFLNENYLIKLDTTKYFFNWKGNNMHLKSNQGDSLFLKQIKD